jgi:hypothetical protein
MSDPSAITWWMAILTILVGIQTIALAFVVIRGVALFKRAESTLGAVDRALDPITRGTREYWETCHLARPRSGPSAASAAIDRVATTTDHVSTSSCGGSGRSSGPSPRAAPSSTPSQRRQPSRKVRDDGGRRAFV